MKKILLSLFVLAFMSAMILTGCKSKETPEQKPTEPETVDPVKRGEYLVTIMGCHDCHSPKQVGQQGFTLLNDKLLSGYPADRKLRTFNPATIKDGWMLMNEDLTAYAGPWGVSFAANLTSSQSGLGNWTIDNFRRAMKEGKYKGLENARMLLPPMPWFNFVNIHDEDLNALFAYLQSTSPVDNVVPMPVPPGK